MSGIQILFLVLQFIFYSILAILGFILLLMSLPIHLEFTAIYMEQNLDYRYRLHYAWIIPLDRFIHSKMTSEEKPVGDRAPSQQKTTPSAIAKKQTKNVVKLHDEQAVPAGIQEQPNVVSGQQTMDYQTILGYVDWGLSQKDQWWRAVVRIFRLLHLDDLYAKGQLGLDDPADTAFLFASIYAVLPSVPFIAWKVQPVYEQSALTFEVRLRSCLILLEILLVPLFNRDIRRTLWSFYRMIRPKTPRKSVELIIH